MNPEFKAIQDAIKEGNQAKIKEVVFSLLRNHKVWLFGEPQIIDCPYWNEDYVIDLDIYTGTWKVHVTLRNIDENTESDYEPFDYEIEGVTEAIRVYD